MIGAGVFAEVGPAATDGGLLIGLAVAAIVAYASAPSSAQLAAPYPASAPVVRVGAAVASLGVLLSLLVGVSRTTIAMTAESDLPRWLDAVHPTRRVPHRADLTGLRHRHRGTPQDLA